MWCAIAVFSPIVPSLLRACVFFCLFFPFMSVQHVSVKCHVNCDWHWFVSIHCVLIDVPRFVQCVSLYGFKWQLLEFCSDYTDHFKFCSLTHHFLTEKKAAVSRAFMSHKGTKPPPYSIAHLYQHKLKSVCCLIKVTHSLNAVKFTKFRLALYRTWASQLLWTLPPQQGYTVGLALAPAPVER